MLLKISKKICPLMTLLLSFSCGKKINEPNTIESRISNQTPEEEWGVLLIELPPGSIETSYRFNRNAWINLPTKLNVESGNALGKRLKIYYNLTDQGDYEFHCLYRSSLLSNEMNFEKCETSYNSVTVSNSDDIAQWEFPMNKNTRIKFELLNSSAPNLRISTAYTIDWK